MAIAENMTLLNLSQVTYLIFSTNRKYHSNNINEFDKDGSALGNENKSMLAMILVVKEQIITGVLMTVMLY